MGFGEGGEEGENTNDVFEFLAAELSGDSCSGHVSPGFDEGCWFWNKDFICWMTWL